MKNVFKIFLMGFLQAVFVIACMILCGVGGYFGSKYYFDKKNASGDEEEKVEDIVDDAQVDEISKNLIYVWNEGKDKISSCVLEVFDTKNHKMDYITIPVNSQITVSADLYQRLCQVNTEIPQVFKLSKLCSYFDKDDDRAYGYGVLVLEDYFNIDISYYTVVDSELFDQAFEDRKVQVKDNGDIKGEVYGYASDKDSKKDSDKKGDDSDYDNGSKGSDPYEHDDSFVTTTEAETTTSASTSSANGSTTETLKSSSVTTSVKIKVLKEDFLSEYAQYTSERDLASHIDKLCHNIKSNLDIKDKKNYVKSYLAVTQDDIRYHCIPGYFDEDLYVFDTNTAEKLFKNCNVNEKPVDKSASKKADKEDDAPKISNIIVLNSTGTSGVAASWSATLKEKGFQVTEVGNYSTRLTDTKIIVKEDGQGEELLRYFKNASIEVGEVPEGTDAQVIIGTNDIP